MKIKLTDGGIPTEEGYYFILGGTGGPELVRVLEYPASEYGGVEFPPYLGIVQWGGKSVEKYRNSPYFKFSPKLEFSYVDQ